MRVQEVWVGNPFLGMCYFRPGVANSAACRSWAGRAVGKGWVGGGDCAPVTQGSCWSAVCWEKGREGPEIRIWFLVFFKVKLSQF